MHIANWCSLRKLSNHAGNLFFAGSAISIVKCPFQIPRRRECVSHYEPNECFARGIMLALNCSLFSGETTLTNILKALDSIISMHIEDYTQIYYMTYEENTRGKHTSCL